MNSIRTPVADPGTGSGTDPTSDPGSASDRPIEAAGAGAIVVGHDGTAGADAALLTALQLASEIHAPLTIVRAWSLVTAPRPQGWVFGYASALEDIDEGVRRELQAQTQAQVARFPTVTTTWVTHHAGPARSLILASKDARMLVVGARGVSGICELVLGSVSDQVVRQAHCPVLVTRGPTR